MMGFAFFYQPAVILLDGKRREAVVFFAQTLGSFAAITLFALLVAFAV